MRAYSWLLFGGLMAACSGSAFTTTSDGTGASGGSPDGGGDPSEGATAGALGSGGRNFGGSLTGTGGNISAAGSGIVAGSSSGGTATGGTGATGGVVGVGGDLNVGGDLVVGGTPSMGGSVSLGGGTTTGGMGGTSDQICPVNHPSDGGACKDGLVCSYGNDVRTSCRLVAQCSGGLWALDKPQCDTLSQCQGVIVGKTCDVSSKPCLLGGDTGIYCVCSACTGAGACMPDPTWACAGSSGGNACRKLPPNEGQACTGSTQCPYGSCATGNNVTATCNGSSWVWQSSNCPLLQ